MRTPPTPYHHTERQQPSQRQDNDNQRDRGQCRPATTAARFHLVNHHRGAVPISGIDPHGGAGGQAPGSSHSACNHAGPTPRRCSQPRTNRSRHAALRRTRLFGAQPPVLSRCQRSPYSRPRDRARRTAPPAQRRPPLERPARTQVSGDARGTHRRSRLSPETRVVHNPRLMRRRRYAAPTPPVSGDAGRAQPTSHETSAVRAADHPCLQRRAWAPTPFLLCVLSCDSPGPSGSHVRAARGHPRTHAAGNSALRCGQPQAP